MAPERGGAYAQNPIAAIFERPRRGLAKNLGEGSQASCRPSSANSKHALEKAIGPTTTSSRTINLEGERDRRSACIK